MVTAMPASAWTPPAALAVLEVACRTVGVDYAGSELVRFGTNAAYRLPDRKHLARVSRPGRDRDAVQRELDIARWLAEERFPALPPADDISDEPLQVGACVVSFWTWLDHDPGRPPDAYEFGKLLRRFHEVSARYVADLPPIDPLGLVARELAWLREHGPYRADDLDLLEGWRERLTAELASVRSQLGEGPLHGDARVHDEPRQPPGARPHLMSQLGVDRAGDQEAVGPRVLLDSAADGAEHTRDVLPLVQEHRLFESGERRVRVSIKRGRLRRAVQPHDRRRTLNERRALPARAGPDDQQRGQLAGVLVQGAVDQPLSVLGGGGRHRRLQQGMGCISQLRRR